MLYVSTRNKTEAYTAFRALHEASAPDGGLFAPFHLEKLEKQEMDRLLSETFGEIVARVLCSFFSVKIDGWNVDFAIGRRPVKLTQIGHKTLIAELWHNPDATYSHVEQRLNKLLGGNDKMTTEWAKIAIRIAVIFATYGEFFKMGISAADISAAAGDFTTPMAAWYARAMGLPIGMIVCGCDNDSAIWDLIHRGEFSPAVSFSGSKEKQRLPAAVERLIHGQFGSDEVNKYLRALQKQSIYKQPTETDLRLGEGLFASVIGPDRVLAVLGSIYKTDHYITTPDAALSYSALQDYRASTGESRMTIVISDCSPVIHAASVSDALGVSQETMRAILNTPKE